MGNLTAYEKKTGWRYSITCTNIPDGGIPGVSGVPGTAARPPREANRQHAETERLHNEQPHIGSAERLRLTAGP
jgi:hypothetical protein